MRRLLFFFLAVCSWVPGQGQIEHLSDFDFAEEPLFYDNPFEVYWIFEHDDYLIITRNNFHQYETKIYQISTAEVTDLDFAVIRQSIVGEERIYTVRFSNGLGYNARFNPSADFTNYPYSFPWGLVNYEGAAYALDQGVFKKYEASPYQVTTIANLSGERFGGYNELIIENDTAYLASAFSMVKISLETGEFLDLHREDIDEFGLRLIPGSGLNGSYLFVSRTAGSLAFYELNHGGLFREIAMDESTNAYQLSGLFDDGTLLFDKGAIASNGNDTYLLNHYPIGDDRFLTQYLLHIDRRPSEGVAKEIGTFVRFKYTQWNGASIWALNDGAIPVVNGLLGPEGNEPYGLVGDSLAVLADLIPGAEGSVDYEVYSDYINGRSFDDPQTWDNRALFLARHIGHGAELTMSDGTPEGTGMIADLVPGGQGLRHVQFHQLSEDSLLAFVQRDDLSFGLYLIGNDLPETIKPAFPESVTTSYLAHFPENYEPINEIPSRELNVKQDEDGSLYHLSSSLFWGYANGDVGPDPDFLEDQFQLNAYCQRLQKIDPQTGDILFSKNFAIRPRGGGASRNPSGLVIHPDGTIRVLNAKQGGYESDEFSVPSNSGDLSLTTFSKEGEFISTKNFMTDGRHVKIRDFEVLSDGTMVALTDKGNSTVFPGYHLVTFSPDGELIMEEDITDLTDVRPNFWLTPNRSELRLALFAKTDGCADQTVLFRGYNSNLSFVDLGRYCYSGDLISPQVFDLPGGDRLFTGAIKGRLFENENNLGLGLNDGNDEYSAFVLRKSTADPALTEIEVISRSATHYYNVLPYNGNRYLQMVEEDESGYHLVTIQLDENLKAADSFRQSMKLLNKENAVRLASGVYADRWWQFTAAGAFNKVHTDTIIAQPLYRLNHSEIRGIHRPWPFEPIESINPTDTQDGTLYSVFPNPSFGNFFLSPVSEGGNPYQFYEMYDVTGKLVLKGVMPNTLSLVEISPSSHVVAGTYELRLIGESNSEHHRIVIL